MDQTAFIRSQRKIIYSKPLIFSVFFLIIISSYVFPLFVRYWFILIAMLYFAAWKSTENYTVLAVKLWGNKYHVNIAELDKITDCVGS